jgi:predicted double-glycine peptidase
MARRAAGRANGRAAARPVPHYAQSTDFTCGPAALIMTMAALDKRVKPDRALELQLWREANTIFMGPSGGHGGCGALGLALAAHRRGFKAEVHVNHKGVLLAARAKSKERAEVMRLLQEKDLAEAKAAGIPVHYDSLSLADLEARLRAGHLPLVLNSMRYLHDDPTAHWFVVTGIDEDNVYVNDPWAARGRRRSARQMTGAAIPRHVFDRITAYGAKKERAAVLVTGRNRPQQVNP